MKIIYFFSLSFLLFCIGFIQKKEDPQTEFPLQSSAVIVSSASSEASFFSPLTKDDFSNALKLLGIETFNIKIPPLDSKKYEIHVYMDTYKKGTLVKSDGMNLGDIKRGKADGAGDVKVNLTLMKKSDR